MGCRKIILASSLLILLIFCFFLFTVLSLDTSSNINSQYTEQSIWEKIVSSYFNLFTYENISKSFVLSAGFFNNFTNHCLNVIQKYFDSFTGKLQTKNGNEINVIQDALEFREDHLFDESEANSDFYATPVLVEFVNESPYRATIYWDDNEDWKRVVDSLAPKETVVMKTFHGHAFVFTLEGTRDQLYYVAVDKRDLKTMKKVENDEDLKLIYSLPGDVVPESKIGTCRDRYTAKCPQYALQKECEKNPGWMIVNCPESCKACELLDPKKRCNANKLNVSSDHVWKSGDMNKMFLNILEMYKEDGIMNEKKLNVISSPEAKYGGISGPWILQFNNFLSEAEVSALLRWGESLGYMRSTDTGTENENGEVTRIFSVGRTSTNAWCTKGCEDDPMVMNVSKRIVSLTNIPYENYEQFQLLRYEKDQYYRVHHDMNPKDVSEKDVFTGGVRILTFFLYLSDVEEGGETEFPRVGPNGIKAQPKRGRAILWPSVKDNEVLAQEPLTFHAALPVIKGEKFAANHWIHSHNFKKANLWGCTGAFD